jgi:hypothetical protein
LPDINDCAVDPAVRPDKCSKDENTEEDTDIFLDDEESEEEGIAPTVGFPPPFIT